MSALLIFEMHKTQQFQSYHTVFYPYYTPGNCQQEVMVTNYNPHLSQKFKTWEFWVHGETMIALNMPLLPAAFVLLNW